MYPDFQSCQKMLDGVQAIDYFLAKQLSQALLNSLPHSEQMLPEHKDLLFHSIIACSEALREGHSCLKLSQQCETSRWKNPDENKTGFAFPTLNHWSQVLIDSHIAPEDNHPLVFEHKRLYLRRYWSFENELAHAIRGFLEKKLPLDVITAQTVIEKLFPESASQGQRLENSSTIDWQKIAVANALATPFTIIAGGPGTGKTFTVTKLLAALQLLSENRLRIAMVAPTGKAAQRLNESIQKAKTFLSSQNVVSDETLDTIPDAASTIHRLLGVRTWSHNFHYNDSRQLPVDLLLVDEISMIDLPLMSRLLRAVRDDCRVIMLGDADQLPSVAAGSVLSDLAPVKESVYSQDNSELLAQISGETIPAAQPAYDHLTVLQKSHRFDGGGEIGQLARQVIRGDSQQSWFTLQQGKDQVSPAQGNNFNLWVEQLVEQFYVPIFNNKRSDNKPFDDKFPENDLSAKDRSSQLNIEQAFEHFNQFRFLAATRLGELGVQSINAIVEDYLRQRGLISSYNDYYPGRPIMISENHYSIGLYNGDIGLLWPDEHGKLRAAFPQTKRSVEQHNQRSNSVKWLSIGRLPAIETVYAMTIHKTQGSEFQQVALVLPQQDSPILSRELLYTGITRASQKLVIWSEPSIWALGVTRQVQRYSGLQKRVFGENKL